MVAALLGLLLGAALVPGLAAGQSTVTDLGTLDGHAEAAASGINSLGQVVGVSRDATGASHAFLWEDGVGMSELPALEGQPSAEAYRINDVGQVVGVSGPDAFAGHAVLWDGGVATDLGTLPGDNYSRATGINEAGWIAGVSYDTQFMDERAVLWQDGIPVDLGNLGGPGFTIAVSVNDAGQVVGMSPDSSGLPHAFRWENGEMTDLGVLPGHLFSQASDINETGAVVGASINMFGESRAFLWVDGAGMVELGAVPGSAQSLALGINRTGHVIGIAFNSLGDPSSYRAILWTDGEPMELPALPGGIGSVAVGLNDAGQVVGESYGEDLMSHAVLWIPEAPPPVEPLVAQASSTPLRTYADRMVTFTCSPSGGVPPYQVEWDFGDGSDPVPADPGEPVTHAYATKGPKTATCTVTDSELVEATDTTQVEVFLLPSVTATANHTATSPGTPVRFTATAVEGMGDHEIEWTIQGVASPVSGATADHSFDVSGEYTATVTVVDAGGEVAEDSVTVTVAHLVVTAEPVDTSVETGASVAFEATATGGAGGYTYRWDFGDGTPSVDGQSVSHAYQKDGTYTPKVTVTDAQGVRNVTTLEAITVAPRQDLGILGIPIPYLIGAILAIVAAAGAGVAIGRRKRRRT
jgi:probable HAF family extracellular repeat protein